LPRDLASGGGVGRNFVFLGFELGVFGCQKLAFVAKVPGVPVVVRHSLPFLAEFEREFIPLDAKDLGASLDALVPAATRTAGERRQMAAICVVVSYGHVRSLFSMSVMT
jgi:hypothetical protein